MDVRQELRASDGDRQQVAERLSAALEDGRLPMDEFLDRIGLAYAAVTCGDLAALHADLPAAPRPTAPGSAAVRPAGCTVASRPAAGRTMPVPAAAGARPAAGPLGVLRGLPGVLRVLWTLWLMAVSVNVVVWVLVTATTGHLLYPWPVWVAGPWGAALFAISAGVTQLRRARRPAEHSPAGSAAA
jgi:hypothetical protein